MDTLHDRLADLADDGPTGGAPAAELWARGKRAPIASGPRDSRPPCWWSAGTVGVALPIEYPVGEGLPDLGDTPGPLAAVWLVPRGAGGAPEAVGLVAETGTFGTLPIDLTHDDPDGPNDVGVALSADGRRIAFLSPARELIVHDLVSGENVSPLSEFETRAGYTWVDATHLLGHVAGGTDGDGWLWEPGTAAKLVDPYTVTYGGTDLSIPYRGPGPRQCSGSSPTVENVRTSQQNEDPSAGRFDVPVLCDVLGITASGILLGYWNSDRAW